MKNKIVFDSVAPSNSGSFSYDSQDVNETPDGSCLIEQASGN